MAIGKSTSLFDWFDKRLAVTKFTQVMMTEYWIPKRINFLWSFGLILIVTFKLLVISGMFLLMYYKPDVSMAFDSVNKVIMQEVEYGWLFRHIHAVSASLIFLIIYIHMLTGIYYGSFKSGREMIWISGMLLFVTFSAEGFSGYMLPWGQMSYWAAQVITNLFGEIPFIGQELLIWIRGDYVVSDATLTRFFALHVLILPLIIIGLIGFHFYALRMPHVNNEEAEDIDFEAEARRFKTGEKKKSKVMPFWPTFIAEDLFVLGVFLILLFYLIFYHYGFAMDAINFIPADPLKTPAHIYPEWYFLWSYEVLRGFYFNGDIGLIAFAIANGIFFMLPWLDRDPKVLPTHRRPLFKYWFWILVVDLVGLTIFGKLPPSGDIAKYSGLFLSILFLALFIMLPLLTLVERNIRKV